VNKDVLKSISAAADKLPKNQQRVADYIMNNWEKALHESSVTMAKKIGVSQSTVVRTVASLGYSGFPDFQATLQELLQDRISSTKRIEQVADMQEGQSVEQKIAQVFALQQENLQITLRHLDIKQTVKAADVLWKGRRIIILGLRTSAGLAHYFGLHLLMIREDVTILSSDYSLLENIQTLTDKDVLVVFSFARYYRNTIDATKLARDRGCTIVGITDKITAPLTAIADLIFHVPVTSMHYSTSYVAAFALIDVLLNIIGTNNKAAVTKALQSMEEGFQKLCTHIYSPENER
jgi:DNA-binding MurR/RpiR family transcriptional regulator